MTRLTVCAPMTIEALALRHGLRAAGGLGPADRQATVIRAGYGPARAAATAARLAAAGNEAAGSDAAGSDAAGTGAAGTGAAGTDAAGSGAARTGAAGTGGGPVAVAGVGGALTSDLRPGDIVVATEASYGNATVSVPSAALLAGELRRAGLTVVSGPVVTVDRLLGSRDRATLAAASGAIAVDLESGPLLAGLAASGRPAVVIRAISDTPGQSVFSPGIVTGGIAALRSLRLAAPALTRWAAACQPRQVVLAGPRSFCAGVERAIEIVERVLEMHGSPVYVRKQIVHNSRVVAELADRGAIFVDELNEVPDGARVVFSAHGVSPEVRREAERRGLQAVDATCPLVAKVHAEARRFAAEGYLVALIGHSGHEEVEGTLGEAPAAMALVETAADVARLRPDDPAKVAYLMQTTLSADEAAGMADAIVDRFPAATGPGSDDICYATTNRQLAVKAIAGRCDVVLVAGSANSSNSRRLVETAERAGTPAYLVDGPEDIELGWLTGASSIGITAGASAPPAVVSQITQALAGLGQVDITEHTVVAESVQFGLPKEVRKS
jgi:4-hydroxy-3-methylbut-2-enyl diphosphate reductase